MNQNKYFQQYLIRYFANGIQLAKPSMDIINIANLAGGLQIPILLKYNLHKNKATTMILKNSDDKSSDIASLRELLLLPSIPPETKKKIETEIKYRLSGIKGESEAAYELNFNYGESSKNWVIIHDLRLEVGGRVAQIDHLLINRFLDMYVCESKRFNEGIAINDHGEFSAFISGRPYGIPSPIEQNEKHISVLSDLFRTGEVLLPKRLGLEIKPSFKNYVLVSKNARISRPKSNTDLTKNIVKVDQFLNAVMKAVESDNNVLTLAKVISQDTLKELAVNIVKCHKPMTVNWIDKFGISLKDTKSGPTLEKREDLSTSNGDRPEPQAEPSEIQESSESAKKSKLICSACDKVVAYSVAKFCWMNKKRFGGKILCQDCQKTAV